jgi:hypothetical protein
MAAAAKKKDETVAEIVIKAIKRQTIVLTVDGDTPLIIHRWSEKARRQMKQKQTTGVQARKSLKVPEEDYEAAKYLDPATGREGVSALAFKSALVSAARFCEGVKQVFLKGALFIKPDFFCDGTPCLVIDGKPRMREDMTRVGMGTADIRYRPEYDPWSVKMTIEFDAELISPQSLVTLVNRAGFSGGVGEWRPSSPKGMSGEFGRFHVRAGEGGAS